MSARRYLVFFAISSWTLLQQISGQFPIKNPCDYFRYIQENGEVIGLITLPNDLSQEYRLNVNMSVAENLTHGENIRLQLVTGIDDIENGQPLQYRVYFPIQRVIPFQTRVEFNGQVYCSGPPEDGGKRTNFWETEYKSTGYPPRRSTASPRPPPSTNPSPTQNFTFSENHVFGTYGTPPTRRTRRNTPSPTPRVTQAPVSECGVVTKSPFTTFHYGEVVALGQFPWLAALLIRIDDSPLTYRCTGTLVSTKHVVSGAFCQVFFKKENFFVLSGTIDIEDPIDSDGIVSRVANIDVHPLYKRDSVDFNIAVFTLDRNLAYTRYIKPICIWQDGASLNDLIGRQGTIAGWGPSGTRDLVEAEYNSISIVSESECETKSSVLQPLFSDNTFCAGFRNGSGICNGNHGAGLMITDENGVWHLLGIVHNSRTDRERTCDAYNLLFFNVAKVMPWLNNIIA